VPVLVDLAEFLPQPMRSLIKPSVLESADRVEDEALETTDLRSERG
jgi:hypothetical protein